MSSPAAVSYTEGPTSFGWSIERFLPGFVLDWQRPVDANKPTRPMTLGAISAVGLEGLCSPFEKQVEPSSLAETLIQFARDEFGIPMASQPTRATLRCHRASRPSPQERPGTTARGDSTASPLMH